MSAGGGGEVKAGKFGGGTTVSQKSVNLNLTPMIDLMTILLVFLVQSFASDPSVMANSADIVLSQVQLTQEKPGEVSVISLSPKALLLDGKEVLPVVINPKDGQPDFPDSAYSGFILQKLFDELGKVSENARAVAKINPARPFKEEIILHADRGVPFALLKPVMRSAGNAGFRKIKIAAKGLN